MAQIRVTENQFEILTWSPKVAQNSMSQMGFNNSMVHLEHRSHSLVVMAQKHYKNDPEDNQCALS